MVGLEGGSFLAPGLVKVAEKIFFQTESQAGRYKVTGNFLQLLTAS